MENGNRILCLFENTDSVTENLSTKQAQNPDDFREFSHLLKKEHQF